MAHSAQEARVLNRNIETIKDKIRQIGSSNLNVVIKSENNTNTGCWFRIHHGMSFVSYGEKITVTLTYLGEDKTQIDVVSECGMPTQIIDYGKNKKNVAAIFNYIIS